MSTSTEATSADSTTGTESATDGTATETDATAPGAEAEAAETDSAEGSDTLGDAGKKALDAMKVKWKDAEKSSKDQAAALAALQAKLDGKEVEHTAAQEAQRVKDEALAGANERILKADIRTAAKGKLTDPNDAFRYPEDIDLSSFEADEDGEFDNAAIAQAIDSLIVKKPYLAAQGGSKFQGSADGGARNGASDTAQLTEADVKRLSVEGKHNDIEEARVAGRLNNILGIK